MVLGQRASKTIDSVQSACFKVPLTIFLDKVHRSSNPENKFQLCTIILIKMLTVFMVQVEQTNARVTAT